MPENRLEITFPTIHFPIEADLHMHALALAERYEIPPPEDLEDVAAIVLIHDLASVYTHERIRHRPGFDGDLVADVKGACFLFFIGTALCRILGEQGREVDLLAVYGRSGRAIFQGCPEEYLANVLEEGRRLAERLYDEALSDGEVNELIQYVMSLGVLLSIEPKEGTVEELVALFERM